jgi:hypothetical protein
MLARAVQTGIVEIKGSRERKPLPGSFIPDKAAFRPLLLLAPNF